MVEEQWSGFIRWRFPNNCLNNKPKCHETKMYSLGKANWSGISLTRSILARSAHGPRITIGLLESAEKKCMRIMLSLLRVEELTLWAYGGVRMGYN